MEALEDNQLQLEPHTLYRGQPMEVVQHWRDVEAIGGMVSIGPNDVNDTQTSGRFTEYIQLYFTIICGSTA